MLKPTLEKAKELTGYSVIPVCREILSDFTTPIEVLKKLRRVSRHVYILESVENQEKWGRYTFLGYNPKLELTCTNGELTVKDVVTGKTETSHQAHPAAYIKELMKKYTSPKLDGFPSFTGGLVGYFSYDYIKYSEPTLNLDAKDEERFKDVDLMLFDKVIAFDNIHQKIGEHGKLYMLQTRNGKRTAQAALKIACDLVDEGMRTEEEAVAMIDPRNLDTLLHPQFDAAALKAATPMGKGLGASPGAACGKIVFSAEDAENWAGKGEKVVLVRLETSPEDITGMKVSQGILTVRGGMTSHAAVVARGMGTCCVSGCGDIVMDEANKTFTLGGKEFHEGDYLSIDGTTGKIYDGQIKTVDAKIAGEFGRVMAWADKYRRLKVRTNADTPHDARRARELGAEGIGLCRTEHMFFEEDRIAAFRSEERRVGKECRSRWSPYH